MKQTYILKQIDKLNQSNMDGQKYTEEANKLIKQITIWDHPDYLKMFGDKKKNKVKEEAGVYEKEEIFNGRKSSAYSKENWERLKKGLPVKLPQIFLPKRLDSRNSITVYGRKIYIVKKNENMTPVKLFAAYDAKTGILLCASWKRDKIEGFLIENLLDKIEYLESEE